MNIGFWCTETIQTPTHLLTELFAEYDNVVEDVDGEVDACVDRLQVWQREAKVLVQRREPQCRAAGHAVLVQSPPCPNQPRLVLWPPHRVVRPVFRLRFYQPINEPRVYGSRIIGSTVLATSCGSLNPKLVGPGF